MLIGCLLIGQSTHKFSTIAALSREITDELNELIKSINKRVNDICKLSKETWQLLGGEETQCKEWVRELERVRDEQIQKIRDEDEKVKEKISHYKQTVTDEIEEFDDGLMAKRDELEEQRTRLHKLTRDGHVTDKIKQKHELTVEVISGLERELGSCELTAQPELVVKAEPTSQYADIVCCPTELTLSSEHNVGSACYFACHRENGDVLLGCEDGVWVLSGENMSLSKAELPIGRVTAVIEHHQAIYILREKDDQCKVEICLPSLKKMETLLEFTNSSTSAAHMSVSDRYVVVFVPHESDGQLLFCNFITKQTKTTHIATYQYPYFLPDGQLLLAGLHELIKYRIEDEELTAAAWTCKPLHNLQSVCADPSGLVYATTCSAQKSIYIISPQGTLLREIKHTELPDMVGHTSVRGDEIAVPCWESDKLQIYKLKYN